MKKTFEYLRKYLSLIYMAIFFALLYLPTGIPSVVSLQYVEWLILTIAAVIGIATIIITCGKTFSCNATDILFIAFITYTTLNFRYFSNEIFIKNITLLLTYFLFRNIRIKNLWRCFYLLVVTAFVQTIYCIRHFSQPWQTVADICGIFQNTGIWGGFIALALCFSIGIALFAKKHLHKIIAVFVCLSLCYLWYKSGSRAAWLAVGFAATYMIYKKFRYWAIPAIVVLVATLPYIYSMKTASAQGRLYIWQTSLNIVKSNIVSGTGQCGFQRNYMMAQREFFRQNSESAFREIANDTNVPFNEFLNIIFEHGIIGLMLFLLLIASVFRKNKKLGIIVKGVLLSLLVFAFFSYPFLYVQFEVVFVLCVAFAAKFKRDDFMLKMPVPIPIILVLSFFVYAVFFYNSAIKFNDYLTDKSHENKDIKANLQSIYPELRTNPLFLTFYAYKLNAVGKYEEAIEILQNSLKYKSSYYQYLNLGNEYKNIKEYSKAGECWEIAAEMIPSRFRPLYNTIEAAIEDNDCRSAIREMERFLYKKTKIQTPELYTMQEQVKAWYKEYATLKNETLENALNQAGNNRAELEKVLYHYRADTLKYRAACFLIENMPNKSYQAGKYIDEYHDFADSVFRIERQEYDIPFIYETFLHDAKYRKTPPIRIFDLKSLSAYFLINHIDESFDVFGKSWNKNLTFEQFCEFILPYRLNDEIPELWRSLYQDKFQKILTDSMTAKNACIAINNKLKETPIHTALSGIAPSALRPSSLINIKFGACEDYANNAVYAMRSLGIPVGIEIIPHWGNAAGNHTFNVLYGNDGNYHDFSGSEENPDEHLRRFKKRIPKIYRETFGIQANSLAMIHGKEPIPALLWLHNHTRGKEERPFIIENGRQIWW